jgi:MFS family permease
VKSHGWKDTLFGPVLVMTTLVVSIISSLGAPLIPTISQHFHTSLTVAQWSLTVTLLSGAVSAPVMGRMGDGPRRRPTIIAGLAVVAVGGAVAAVAPSFVDLVVGRALQGVGLGLVPLAMATVRDSFPSEKVAPMVGLLSVTATAGAGVGYPLTGLLADAGGLPAAYWFGAGVTVFAMLCALVVLPSSAHLRSHRMDISGAGLLTVGLVAVLVAVAQGSAWGWTSVAVLVLLLGGIAVLGLWATHELRAPRPLVEVRLLRHPAVLAGNSCAMLLAVAMYMLLASVTEFVQTPSQDGFGFSAPVIVAGLILIPLSVVMPVASRFLPALIRTLGLRVVLGGGCLVVAVAAVFFGLSHSSIWEAYFMMGLLGIGLGTTFAAIPSLIVHAVPPDETGSALGFYQVVRNVGFSLGSAVAAAILASRSGAGGRPTLDGYQLVFWVVGAICVVAAGVAWALIGDRPVTHRAGPVESLTGAPDPPS